MGSDKREALRAYADLFDTSSAKKPRTCGQLFDIYQLEVIPQKSEGTRDTNLKELKWLRHYYSDAPVVDVDAESAREYIRNRTGKTRAKREISLLSAMLTWATQQGWLSSNPLLGAQLSKMAVKTSVGRQLADKRIIQRNAVLPEQYEAACSILDSSVRWIPVRWAMEIGALTGLRRIDVLGIRREWATDEGLYAMVSKSVHWDSNRDPATVFYYWTPSLEMAVDALLQYGDAPARSGTDWLVCQRSGGRYTDSGFNKRWQVLMNKVEEQGQQRFGFHDLRRTFSTIVTQQTLAGRAQNALTHSSPRTTFGYQNEPYILEAADNILDRLHLIRRKPKKRRVSP